MKKNNTKHATGTLTNSSTDVAMTARRLRRIIQEHEKTMAKRAITTTREQLELARTSTENELDPYAAATVLLARAVEECRSVVGSMGLDSEFDVHPSSEPTLAWTDFSRLSVRIRLRDYDARSPESIARMVALTRGLIYHEAGHILFSLPWSELEKSADDDFPMTDSFEVTDEFVDRFLLDGTQHPGPAWMMKTANVLEDQRMEAALVRMSPMIANYLRVAAGEMIIRPALDTGSEHTVWPFICGRRFLNAEIRHRFRSIAWERAHRHGLVDVLRQIEENVATYMSAGSAFEMWIATGNCAGPLSIWLDQRVEDRRFRLDEHSNSSTGSSENGTKRPLTESMTEIPVERIPDDCARRDVERLRRMALDGRPRKGETDPSAGRDRDKDRDGGASPERNVDGLGQSDAADTSADDGTSAVAGTSRRSSPEKSAASTDDSMASKDELFEVLTDEIQRAVSGTFVNQLIGLLNQTERRGISPAPTITPMNELQIIRSETIANSMLAVLSPLVEPDSFAWTCQEENGVLDPIGYRLREPGDTAYWTDKRRSNAEHHDLALSVVLDFSGSMCECMESVSESAMGIRLACDDLGIPCTISAFNDNGYLVIDAAEETRLVALTALGGTDPTKALSDLGNQREGRKRHLVVVFTDGEWPTSIDFGAFREDGMWALGLGFGAAVAQSLRGKGFDSVGMLRTTAGLAGAVTTMLHGFLAS